MFCLSVAIFHWSSDKSWVASDNVTILSSPYFEIHFCSLMKHPRHIYIISVRILKVLHATRFPASAENFLSFAESIKLALGCLHVFLWKICGQLFRWVYSCRVTKLANQVHLVSQMKSNWSYTATGMARLIMGCSTFIITWNLNLRHMVQLSKIFLEKTSNL